MHGKSTVDPEDIRDAYIQDFLDAGLQSWDGGDVEGNLLVLTASRGRKRYEVDLLLDTITGDSAEYAIFDVTGKLPGEAGHQLEIVTHYGPVPASDGQLSALLVRVLVMRALRRPVY